MTTITRIRQSIMPPIVQFARVETPRALDLRAIACFAAAVFFLKGQVRVRASAAIQESVERDLD